jgi:hypothetical protein
LDASSELKAKYVEPLAEVSELAELMSGTQADIDCLKAKVALVPPDPLET